MSLWTRSLIAVAIGCAFFVSAIQVSPAAARPPVPTSPAPKSSCKLKRGGSIAHGESITYGGKHYRCNNGKWEQYAYA